MEKPWGRRDLPAPFGGRVELVDPIGEMIFDPPPGRDSELLVKYLFTAERSSIQVHPPACETHGAGVGRGKDEAWIVIAADPEAAIGFGLRKELSSQCLRDSVTDGSIEKLVDWRPVGVGDCFYSPAGTIHAIGAGISLIEIQQNCDVTYRLHDFGRGRELHVEEGITVAICKPAASVKPPRAIYTGRTWLTGGPAFQVERFSGPTQIHVHPRDGELWVLLVHGAGRVGTRRLRPACVWWIGEACQIRLYPESELIVAYPGGEIAPISNPF